MASGESILKRLQDRGLVALVDLVAKTHHVTRNDILGRGRTKTVARARHYLFAELRRRGFSYPEIGWLLQRDHTTVQAGVRKVAAAQPAQTEVA